ncbi:MAG: ATP-binding protein [Pseudomonadota bacterium]
MNSRSTPTDTQSSTPFERAIGRERAAREQAEQLLESKSRELYLANEALKEEHDRVQRRNEEIQTAHAALQEAQAQLVQSEKLASVGQLAAGVAHEINNPIGFIMSNLGTLNAYADVMAQLIRGYQRYARDTAPDDTQTELLNELRKLEEDEDIEYVLEDLEGLLEDSIAGSKRVRDIVQGLKSFSRIDDAQVSDQDIHEGINSTLKVVANEIKYRCEVVKKFGDLPLIPCNLAQVNQVFMNLLINAAQAMEGQGVIVITTSVEDDNALLVFEDNGVGIPRDKLGSIFDPFFTTKPIGTGTGLGLSISYGIIQEHGGSISVSSEEGVGTSFSIRLPLHAIDEAAD